MKHIWLHQGNIMPSPLSSLLFKDYRRRVLGLLLLHPERQYHVREIARLTDTVPGTLHKELTSLADAGVLLKEAIGNQVEYAANRDCPIFAELASILRKTSGIVDVLADALMQISKNIEIAFVFGSVARGKETAGSDIDVLVVGEVSFTEVVKALYSAQEILGREINSKVYSRKEWKKILRANDAFIKEVMANEKLFILGDANELE
jgi:predicted nucleotidyltransferase